MISHTRDLILVDGKNRTDSVAKVRFVSDMCEVVYAGSATPYHYRRSRVQVLKFKRQLDPAAWLVTVNGRQLQQVKAILDFEKYYRSSIRMKRWNPTRRRKCSCTRTAWLMRK